jgi:hypothetical protein
MLAPALERSWCGVTYNAHARTHTPPQHPARTLQLTERHAVHRVQQRHLLHGQLLQLGHDRQIFYLAPRLGIANGRRRLDGAC